MQEKSDIQLFSVLLSAQHLRQLLVSEDSLPLELRQRKEEGRKTLKKILYVRFPERWVVHSILSTESVAPRQALLELLKEFKADLIQPLVGDVEYGPALSSGCIDRKIMGSVGIFDGRYTMPRLSDDYIQLKRDVGDSEKPTVLVDQANHHLITLSSAMEVPAGCNLMAAEDLCRNMRDVLNPEDLASIFERDLIREGTLRDVRYRGTRLQEDLNGDIHKFPAWYLAKEIKLYEIGNKLFRRTSGIEYVGAVN
jgi:hypothetical protein